MKQSIWKNKKWIGYILYCLILTFALLYYRFPEDAFINYIQATAQRIDPGLLVRFKSLSPNYPFGLKCREARLTPRGNPDNIILKAETFYFIPKVLTLFKGDPVYCFKGLAYGGNIKGCLHLIKQGLDTAIEASVTLNDILLDDNSALPANIGKHVSGVLNGTITCNGKSKSFISGTGEAILSLENGKITLSLPLLSLKTVDFKEILLKIAFKNQKLKLSQAVLKGDGITGTASGTLDMKRDFPLSRLNIRVSIEPHADFVRKLPNGRDAMQTLKRHLKNGKFSFHVSGTIKDPKIRLI